VIDGVDKKAPRILIVEDGIIMARDIQHRLDAIGYNVVGIATTGEEAVEKSKRLLPDLLLMDVNLRGVIDGINAAQQIARDSDVPIVFVTAYSDEATLKRARSANPFGYVLKPFDDGELRTTIEMALFRHGLHRSLTESERRYREIADLTSDYAYALKVDAKKHVSVDWVTDSFRVVTGFPAQELSAMPRHIHPEDLPLYRKRMSALLEGEPQVLEYRVKTASGTLRWIREHVRAVRDRSGKEVVCIFGAAKDITDEIPAARRNVVLPSALREVRKKP
jgi:PAS domain S-box-containing protein